MRSDRDAPTEARNRASNNELREAVRARLDDLADRPDSNTNQQRPTSSKRVANEDGKNRRHDASQIPHTDSEPRDPSIMEGRRRTDSIDLRKALQKRWDSQQTAHDALRIPIASVKLSVPSSEPQDWDRAQEAKSAYRTDGAGQLRAPEAEKPRHGVCCLSRYPRGCLTTEY
jgi:hypothetical protein